jgi:hypothetical protein
LKKHPENRLVGRLESRAQRPLDGAGYGRDRTPSMRKDPDGPDDFLAQSALADDAIGARDNSRGGESAVCIGAVDENAWRTREALQSTTQRQAITVVEVIVHHGDIRGDPCCIGQRLPRARSGGHQLHVQMVLQEPT